MSGSPFTIARLCRVAAPFQGAWPSVVVTAGLHLFALIRIAQTEVGLFGQGLFLLTWILLNCTMLLLVRRAALAAAVSLGLIELLILVSQFKFKITWMTASFLDVMVIDPGQPDIPAVGDARSAAGDRSGCDRRHRSDRRALEVRPHENSRGYSRRWSAAASLAAIIVLSNAVPEQPHEPFQGVNHVSNFARSTVVSLSELSDSGWLDFDRAVASRMKALPADDECKPRGQATAHHHGAGRVEFRYSQRPGREGAGRLWPPFRIGRRQVPHADHRGRRRTDLVHRIQRAHRALHPVFRPHEFLRHASRRRPHQARAAAGVAPLRLQDLHALSRLRRLPERAPIPEKRRYRSHDRRARDGRPRRRARQLLLRQGRCA